MNKLLVGCPVFKRDWILPDWFRSVNLACRKAGHTPSFVFVADPHDQLTVEVIDRWVTDHGCELHLVWCEEPVSDGERDWNPQRYQRMAYLRNQLLETVRQLQPTAFLSLDSDVLLHVDAIAGMFELLAQTVEEGQRAYAAVGSKIFLTELGRSTPNYAFLRGLGGLQRADTEGTFAVDVLMAVKLMLPEAYAVDYQPHDSGEDVGWSMACKQAGLRLGFDGRVCSKHVMTKAMHHQVDQRCGY